MHFALQLMLTKSHLFLVDLLVLVLMYFAKEEVSVVFLSCLLGTIKSIEIDENIEREKEVLSFFRDWAQPLVTEGHFWLF